ncbi:alkaline phosphatase family protein [uncultured Parasphingopyxis sp.]|uniref:alkaline phosphatase family protein n=1 Tax=uncultured Parasphingopyxis sp. TaxID=1547918 RepID=UPI00261F7F98|nr:alkaline phosphatase family protein [uncultured Parasphingopyxis sp.]
MPFARFSALVTPMLMALSAPAAAQQAEPARPSLVVAISVDQLSADLFATHRSAFTGGLARLLGGVVFPSGYQAHAATETCPGHSTILTGAFPARSGIIANRWFDMGVTREDVRVYCAEDVAVEGSTSSNYTRSNANLLVPTLGDLLRAADPESRTVAVAGKDRSAIMMGGRTTMAYWPESGGFASYAGSELPASVTRVNQAVGASVAQAQEGLPVPAHCAPFDRAIPLGNGQSVGTGRFAHDAGDASGFLSSPEADLAVLNLASEMVREQQLGQRGSTDVLAIGLAATDYIGHRYGTHGLEQCIQIMSLDSMLGAFFEELDASGINYVVVLTADHGGLDLPERQAAQGAADAARLTADLDAIADRIAEDSGLPAPVIRSDGPFGDFYIDPSVPEDRRSEILDRALTAYSAHQQVRAVYTGGAIAAQPLPTDPPEQWTLLDRLRASYHPDRSGDFLVVLEPRVTPIPDPGVGYVATHGSPWDYDRRVPILFWWNGAEHFEQPLGVMTVDILPTLASLIGFDLGETEIDGRCLDVIAAVDASNCSQ